MKVFLQSAEFDDIRATADAGLLDGIALSYTDMSPDSSVDLKDRLGDIDREFAVPVVVPVGAVTGNEIYHQGRELARASDHVIVQVPFVEDAIAPIRRLVADGVSVCATYVYNGAQAFLAAKIGASMVVVEVDDFDTHGQRGALSVAEIRDVINQSDLECDLVVSSLGNSQHFTECLLAGADIACVTPTLLRSLKLHSLTDRGVDRFLSELSRRHKTRGT